MNLFEKHFDQTRDLNLTVNISLDLMIIVCCE